MKSIQCWLNVVALILLLDHGTTAASAQPPPLRIMPLGDSITEGCCGSSSEGSYRNQLYSLLQAAGYTVDFVGTQTDLNNPTLPDRDHQGMPGSRINGLRASIGIWLKSVDDPDVILLHAGTNDFTEGATATTVLERMENLLADITRLRPYARVLVASPIIRTDSATLAANQAAFAQALPQLVAEQTAAGRHVTLVDQHSALNPEDLSDGVHPNQTGYQKMADAWFPQITAVVTPLGIPDPPAIAGVDPRGSLTSLTVIFNKPVADDAASTENFSLSSDVQVLGATLDAVTKRSISLTTSPQVPGILHTLTVSGIRDRSSGASEIAPLSSMTFTSRAVENGSFESDSQGWTGTGNFLVAGGSLPATNGTNILVFNGAQSAPTGMVSQTVPTIPGQNYRLAFDLGVHDFANQTQSLEVTVEGAGPLLSRTESLTGEGSGRTSWTGKSYEFVADSENTVVTLRDASLVTNNIDLVVDDVRLDAQAVLSLAVNSTPDSGANITVSPVDNDSNGNGATPFSRFYNEGVAVNLTAPASHNGRVFSKWLKAGNFHSSSASTNVTTDAGYTLTAVYQILANSGFELGTPGDFGSLDGWTVSGKAEGYLLHSPAYTPTEGNRLALFNGGSDSQFNGVISQTFNTVIGQTYQIEFDHGITGTAGRKQRLNLTVAGDGNLLATQSDLTATGAATLWTRRSHTFTANALTTTITFSDGSLAFTSAERSSADMMLDDVIITETGVLNAPPVAVDDSSSVVSGSSLVVAAPGVLANDHDPEAAPITAVLESAPAHGNLTLNTDGSFTYIPSAGYTGADSFSYRAHDGNLPSNVATVNIVVNAEGASIVVNGSFENGSPADLGSLDGWTVGGNTNAAVGYTEHLPGYNVKDGNGSRLLLFNGGNTDYSGYVLQTFDTTSGQTYRVTFDLGITGTSGRKQRLLSTISNVLPGETTIFSRQEEIISTGTATLWAPTFSYTFVATGSRTTLRFDDDSNTLGGTTASSSDLLVDNVRVVLLPTRTLAVESSPVSGMNITVSPNDLGDNGNGTTPFNRSYVDGSMVSLTAAATSGELGFVKWRKNGADFATTPGIEVTLDANHTLTAVYTTIGSPISANDAYSTDEDSPLVVNAPGILVNDTDPNSDPLTSSVETGPTHGSLTLNPDGSFTYTPTTNYHGTDSFTYIASDGTLQSDPSLVTLTINPINDTPVASSQSLNLDEDSSLPVTLAGSDVENDPLTFTITASPQHGMLTGTPPDLTYTPDEDFSGSDSFDFVVNDGALDSSTASVAITVNPIADPPVATGDTFSLTQDQSLVINSPGVLENDTDADNNALTAILVAGPAQGTFILNANGSFTYTPAPGFAGTDSFTYRASDGSLLSEPATVTITVNPGPPNLLLNGSFEDGQPADFGALDSWTVGGISGAAVGYTEHLPGYDVKPGNGVRLLLLNGANNEFTGQVSQSFATTPGEIYTIDLDVGITGTAGRKQRLRTIVTDDADTTTLISQVHEITATGAASFWSPRLVYAFEALGTSTTITLSDDSDLMGVTAQSADLLVDNVRVTPGDSNLAPVAANDSYVTLQDTPLSVPAPGVLTNDTDANEDPLAAVLVSNPSHGSLTLSPDGSFTYTPNTSFAGNDTFTYKVSDGQTDSNTATATITVTSTSTEIPANGSFEIGAVVTEANPDPDPSQPGSPGSITALDHWTVTGSVIGYAATSSYSATDGSRLAVFNGGGNSFNGSISQSISTEPDMLYTLEFDAGIFATISGKKQRLLVSIEGTGTLLAPRIIELTGTSGTTLWSPKSYTFIGNGSPATLTFTDQSGSIGGTTASSSDLLLDHVRITPTSGNVAPAAVNDSYNTVEDNALVVAAPGVLDNDTDSNSDPLTALLVTGPSNGSLTLNPDGGFTYTPTAAFSGTDSFTYKAHDGSADSNVATVTITVTDSSGAIPVNGSFEQGAIVNGAITALDHWTVTGTPFGYVADSSYTARDGARLAVFNGGNDTTGGSISQQFITETGQAYQLDAWVGIKVAGSLPRTQRIQFIVADGNTLLSETTDLQASPGVAQWTEKHYTFIATSNLTTLTINDLSATLTATQFTSSDLLLDHVRITPIITARALTVSSTPGTAITITASPADLGSRSSGSTPFTLSYADGTAVTLTAPPAPGNYAFQKWQENNVDLGTEPSITVTIDSDRTLTAVYVVDNSPRVNPDSFTTAEDVTLAITSPGVLANDTDPNAAPITAVLETNPLHGTLVLNPDGGFTYTPEADFNGNDSFTYRATNGGDLSTPTTVSIEVNPIDDPPTALASSLTTSEDVSLDITLEGSDPENDPLTFSVTVSPAHGQLVGTPPELSYVPNPNYQGADTFSFTVADATSTSAPAMVDLSVTPVADPPVASTQSLSVTRGTSIPIVLTGSDADGDALTFTVISTPAHGTLSGTPPNLTYRPIESYLGSDSFSFVANDGAADSTPATISLTVTETLLNGSFEQVTSLVPNYWTTSGNYVVSLGTTSRPSTDPTTTSRLLVFNDGGRTPNAVLTQSFATTPGRPYRLLFDLGVNGAVQQQKIRVSVSGSSPAVNTVETITGIGGGGTAWIPKSYTFTATNSVTTLQFKDETLSSVAVNTDALLDHVRVVPDVTHTLTVNSPSVGSIGVNVTPTDLYGAGGGVTEFTRVFANATPVTLTAPTTVGSSLFVKWTRNGSDLSLMPSVSITADASATITAVYAPNEAPQAVDDAYSTNEDMTLTIPASGVLINDTDPESQSLTAVLETGPEHGALALDANGGFNYQPEPGFSGDDSFTYRASDGGMMSEPATVAIHIQPINDPPVATEDSYSLNEDHSLLIPAPGILANDSDEESPILTAILVDDVSHGTLFLTPDGGFSYEPAPDFNGIDSFTYKASDGELESPVTTITITVEPVNDSPVALDDSYAMDEDSALIITQPGLLVNDSDDSSSLTATLVANVSHGILTMAPNGSFSYEPQANFSGTDSFTYQVSDGALVSNVATVSITINPVNDRPVANADTFTTGEDTGLVVDAPGLLANDTDIEGSPLTASLVGDVSHGTLSLDADGSFAYMPAPNFSGTDSFIYQVNDGSLDSETNTVTIMVNPVNDAPVSVADAYAIDEDAELTVVEPGVLANDSDPEGPPLIAEIIAMPSHGTLTFNADGSFNYQPEANFNGQDAFTYTASDGNLTSEPAVVTITINPVNDPPLAIADTFTTGEDSGLVVNTPGLLANDTDIEGSPLTASLVSDVSHGTLSLNADGSFAYMPAPDFSGTDSFTYAAQDGSIASTPATVTIHVTPTPLAQFASWMAGFGLAPEANGDPDKDTVANAVEYVIGGNPATGNDLWRLPASTSVNADPDGDGVSSNYLLFTYRRTDLAYQDPHTTIAVQWNNGLSGAWTNASGTTGVIIKDFNDAFGPGVDRVMVYLPASLATRGVLFARLGVTISEDPSGAPVANAQSVTTDEDRAVDIVLTGRSLDNTSYTVTIPPQHGNLAGSAPNITYTPHADYNGTDSFAFTVSNSQGTSTPALVSITVNPMLEYTQWITGYGHDANATTDSDGDSVSDAVEWLVGGSPENNDAALSPTITLATADPDGDSIPHSYLLFTYRRATRAQEDPDTSVTIEWATELEGSWHDSSSTPGVVIVPEQDAAEPGIDFVRVYIPKSLAVNGKLFARLGVSTGSP